MHLAEFGKGEPVVMLHGWPQNWYVWRRVAVDLASEYRVICPDLRGHGWTEAPPSGYDKETMADDLLAVLDALELEAGVRLVGHDWGALAGFLACLREPHRFERYVALNMTHPWFDPAGVGLDVWRSWYQVVFASGLGEWILRLRPGLVKQAVRFSLTDKSAMTDDDLDAYIDPLSLPARAAASVQVYRQLFVTDVPRMLSGRYRDEHLTVPTRLIFGADDLAVSEAMLRGFEGHADDMELEVVEGTGHFIVDEMPDLVSDRLRSFFVLT